MSLLSMMYVMLRTPARKTAFKCICLYLYIFLRHFFYCQFSGTETFKRQKIFPSLGISCPLLCQAALTSHHTDKMVGMLKQASFPNWELRWALLWIISILSFPIADSSVLWTKICPSFRGHSHHFSSIQQLRKIFSYSRMSVRSLFP